MYLIWETRKLSEGCYYYSHFKDEELGLQVQVTYLI